MRYYENFEGAVLSNTETYYNYLVPQWLQHYSSADYVLKVIFLIDYTFGPSAIFGFSGMVQKRIFSPERFIYEVYISKAIYLMD